MESLEDIEKALLRLVPSALSEEGQRSLEDLIDTLAAEEPVVVEMPAAASRRPWGWIAGGIGSAAAAVVISLSMPALKPDAPQLGSNGHPQAVPVSTQSDKGGVVLLEQLEKVEAAQPEDWMSESDGIAHRAWRRRVLSQERVQDLQTGYEITVSNPREEVILMPVTAF